MANPSDDHEHFMRVLDGVPIGLAFYDSRGALLHQNRTLLRILEDASQRVVAGISEDATARAVQAALSRLLDELVTNNPIRIRLAIDNTVKILDHLATSDKALENAAELEAVKLVLSNAAELLPVQLSQ